MFHRGGPGSSDLRGCLDGVEGTSVVLLERDCRGMRGVEGRLMRAGSRRSTEKSDICCSSTTNGLEDVLCSRFVEVITEIWVLSGRRAISRGSDHGHQ